MLGPPTKADSNEEEEDEDDEGDEGDEGDDIGKEASSIVAYRKAKMSATSKAL